MKTKLIFALLFCLAQTLYGQDGEIREGHYKLRLGGGGQVGLTLFSPGELHEYANDIWYYYQGLFPGLQDRPNIPKYNIGFLYQYKADLRLLNFFTFEAWRENMDALQVEVFCDMYDTQDPNSFFKSSDKFKPSYEAEGLNLLLTPGSKRGNVFFTIGGGYGRYDLFFRHINNVSINNWYGASGSESFERSYQARVEALSAIIGLTYTAGEIFEFETFFTYRNAKATRMETKEGQVFINEFRQNKSIAGDFTGYDFRIGLKLMIP
jgi:hypothetical protein